MLLVHLLNELKTHDENKTCRDSGLSPLHSIMWDSALANQSERSLPSAVGRRVVRQTMVRARWQRVLRVVRSWESSSSDSQRENRDLGTTNPVDGVWQLPKGAHRWFFPQLTWWAHSPGWHLDSWQVRLRAEPAKWCWDIKPTVTLR